MKCCDACCPWACCVTTPPPNPCSYRYQNPWQSPFRKGLLPNFPKQEPPTAMNKFFLLTTAAATAVFLHAASTEAAEYSNVLADKSTLVFQSKQMGVAAQGRFAKF